MKISRTFVFDQTKKKSGYYFDKYIIYIETLTTILHIFTVIYYIRLSNNENLITDLNSQREAQCVIYIHANLIY